MPETTHGIADRLVQLGFSQYEARTYLGLLATGGATGYSVSNDTGVPQPKVYETLRRLVARGAALQTGERPARYAAVSPETLLGRLQEDFTARVEEARRGLAAIPRQGAPGGHLALERTEGFGAGAERAAAAIEGARSRVYLHGRSRELEPLGEAVLSASDRGVQFVIVHFGALPFRRPRGQVLRHASTEGTLYASRKVRHLAVAVDSHWSLWALARDGERWEGLVAESPLVASLVKTYIRHDLFVQRIYTDFTAELEAAYGTGLMTLTDLSEPPGEPGGSAEEGAG